MTGNVATMCADVVSCKSPSHDGCFVHTLDLPSPSIMCSTSHIHHHAPLLAEVNCVVVLVTQYEFRSHGVCVQRNKFLLTQPPPPPPESHNGGTAHEAPTNTGHCTYQVIRALVLKNTFSENLWSQSVCVRRPENPTFQVSCHVISIQGLFTSAVNPEHFGGSRK